MDKEMLKQADDWLKSMLEIASEQKEADMIEHMKERIKVQKWLMEQVKLNKRYREARKKIEEKYDLEYNIQNQEYMGGIADGLMIAMGIIDRTLEGEELKDE